MRERSTVEIIMLMVVTIPKIRTKNVFLYAEQLMPLYVQAVVAASHQSADSCLNWFENWRDVFFRLLARSCVRVSWCVSQSS